MDTYCLLNEVTQLQEEYDALSEEILEDEEQMKAWSDEKREFYKERKHVGYVFSDQDFLFHSHYLSIRGNFPDSCLRWNNRGKWRLEDLGRRGDLSESILTPVPLYIR